MSTTYLPGRRKRGAKTGTQIVVRCDDELLEQIDRWRSGVIPPETRAGALRWFAQLHFLRLRRWRTKARRDRP